MRNICRINGKIEFNTSTFFGFGGLAKYDPNFDLYKDNSPAMYLYNSRNENVMWLIERALLRSIE